MSAKRVDKENLLKSLEAVSPGLSKRDLVEQSSCFVFKDGYVTSYNEEICCRAKSPLNGVVGAVAAGPLIDILKKIPDETIEVDAKGKEFHVTGRRKAFGVRMEEEVTLPVDKVERPGKEDWRPVPPGFWDALSLVEQCAGRNQDEKGLTCVHIHPKWMEACDRLQLARHRLKTGVAEPIMVPRDSIRSCASLDMTKIAETETWVHFKNPAGLTFSCLRFLEKYPDLSKFIQNADVGAKPLTLPLGLAEAVDRAATVCKDQSEDEKQILVELKPGKMRLKGIGVAGWYAEVRAAKYSGPPLAFLISPKLLIEITAKHTECTVTKDSLKIDGGRWVYVTSLGSPEEREKAAEENAERAAAAAGGTGND